MCPEGSPLKVANTDTILNDLDGSASEQTTLGDSITSKQSKSFIADTDAAADFCHNPSIFSLVSAHTDCTRRPPSVRDVESPTADRL